MFILVRQYGIWVITPRLVKFWRETKVSGFQYQTDKSFLCRAPTKVSSITKVSRPKGQELLIQGSYERKYLASARRSQKSTAKE
jgi:hypothetical protein